MTMPMVEDLVYPSLTRVVRETLDRDVLDLSIRRKRRLPGGEVKNRPGFEPKQW